MTKQKDNITELPEYNKLLKYANLNNNSLTPDIITEIVDTYDGDIRDIIEQLERDNIKVVDYIADTYNADLDKYTNKHITDSLKYYLNEIGKYKLLTADQEQFLAKGMAEAREKIEDISKKNRIKKKVILKLFNKFSINKSQDIIYSTLKKESKKMSDTKNRKISAELYNVLKLYYDLRQTFVESNLRLVVNIAKKYTSYGLPILDLINEGNLGLMLAVEKFDHTFKYRFSTYATWWIKQSIRRSLADKGRNIRIPVHISDMVLKWKRTTMELSQELSRTPTFEEIAKELNIPLNKAFQIHYMSQDVSSLDSPAGDLENDAFGSFIEDETAFQTFDSIYLKDLEKELKHILTKFKPKEQKVIIHRYGLFGKKRMSLSEVGGILGLTRERVRQIQEKVIRKIRSIVKETELKNYF